MCIDLFHKGSVPGWQDEGRCECLKHRARTSVAAEGSRRSLVQGAGSWELNTGSWILGSGGRELNAGSWELDAGSWILGSGGRELDAGLWGQGDGRRYLPAPL